jgi:ribonuclease P protein component
MDFSFSRKYRLTSKQDFESVFAKPEKTKHGLFLALYKPNHLLQPRLGIIIKKSVIKQAVKRVMLRRIIRESFRHHKERIKGLDIIVLVRAGFIPLLDKSKIRESVDALWPLIGIKMHIPWQ